MKKAILEFVEETTTFFNFLKNPKELLPIKQSFDTKAKIFSILFFLEIVLHIIFIIPISYLVDYFLQTQSTDVINFTLMQQLFLAAFLVPIIEEIIFRLPLRFKNNYLLLIINKIFRKDKIKQFWGNNFRWFFYGSAICFGIVHASNFENERTLLFFLFIPIITLSQSLGGLIIGYLRLKFGFWYGVLYHTIFNFLVIIISYSVYHKTELFIYENNNVEILATYLEVKETTNSFYTIDEKEGLINKIEARNYPFDLFTETVFNKKYTSADVQMLDFKLNSKEGITRKELLKILKQEIDLDSL